MIPHYAYQLMELPVWRLKEKKSNGLNWVYDVFLLSAHDGASSDQGEAQ
jgi:hypothetical protein